MRFMRMSSFSFSCLFAIVAAGVLCTSFLHAQQTLGGITGEVTDASGGVIPNVTVSLTHEGTSLARTTKTNDSGEYTFVNLPIGAYTLTYTADGYQAQKTPHITVQADRTATLNVSLKVGEASTTVEVEAAPLMNAVDTTNGYVMETATDRQCAVADRQFYRPGDPLARRECGVARRHRRQLRSGQCADLGQRPARYFKRISC